MKRYKKVIVPLDLSAADFGALSWASKISHLAESHEVLFIHTIDMPEVPQKALEKYPWLAEPIEETVLKKMTDLVAQRWEGRQETEHRFKVLKHSSPLLSILHATLEEDPDLIIIGREAFGRDIAIRLARKAACSVMSVPAGSEAKLQRILVPTDFSECSKAALDVGIAFVEAAGIDTVDSLHVYSLGNFSHRVALPESELKNINEEFAEEKHAAHLQTINSRGVHIQAHLMHSNLISSAIVEYAISTKTSLIVAGHRGKDTVSALLLGSTIEELLKHSPVAVIAAKQKGTGRKLLEDLLSA